MFKKTPFCTVTKSRSTLIIFTLFILSVQPFQSGRTQLEPVPELPGIFCKYVSLERENFAKTANATRINIFLTVSWDQRDQEPFTNETMAKDASASWSEDVTDKGFKACVLVAGRHLASDFPAPPAVHWVAVQEEFFREGAKTKTIKVGSVVMDTWYTGTQCKRIPSRSYQTRYFVSVTHTEPRSFSNAMTVWTERDRRFGFAFVCARELQNFDGIHKGVVVVSYHLLIVSNSLLVCVCDFKQQRLMTFTGLFFTG